MKRILQTLLCTAWLCAAYAQHEPPMVWLVTYGSGERVEEQFGHNALWIRDPGRGIDKIYNFGFFDFDQPGFYRAFASGQMIYFALARSPEEEFSYYQWRDREIRVQQLALTADRIRRLTDWLEARIQPGTRDFRYDYYYNNCSNRIRDALDHALDGRLQRYAVERPARLNFREHTRRMLADAPLLYLATELALGRRADRPITLWEEMFLPEVLAEALGEFDMASDADGSQPLVLADLVLYASTRPQPPRDPSFAWPAVLWMLGAGLCLVLTPLGLARDRGWRLLGARLWIVCCALLGLGLAALWWGTEHRMAACNENLLLFNPLWLLLIRFRNSRIERLAGGMLAAMCLLALALKLLPGAQWNHELLVAVVPVHAAVLWTWLRLASHAAPGRQEPPPTRVSD
ncbi:MAG: DUF4105 domain-containing protein [Wenzhouxiangellaceae bacterium]